MFESVCWSLQCLISALTQGGGGGHFFTGMLRTASSQAWTDSPAEPAEGANPASTLIQTSGFWCHERRPCWCSKPSSVWSCVKAGLGKQHGPRLDAQTHQSHFWQPLLKVSLFQGVSLTLFSLLNPHHSLSCTLDT